MRTYRIWPHIDLEAFVTPILLVEIAKRVKDAFLWSVSAELAAYVNDHLRTYTVHSETGGLLIVVQQKAVRRYS